MVAKIESSGSDSLARTGNYIRIEDMNTQMVLRVYQYHWKMFWPIRDPRFEIVLVDAAQVPS